MSARNAEAAEQAEVETRRRGFGHFPAADGERAVVLGRGIELTTRSLFTLVWEDFVRDALFHVVGFAGEDQERLVLSFPAEARDRAVVATAILATRDAKVALGARVRGLVGEDCLVGDGFDQSRTKRRSGDAEDRIIVRDRRPEVGLEQGWNLGRLARLGDGEQVVYTTVGRPVRIGLEAHLAHRPVALMNGQMLDRSLVARPPVGHRNLQDGRRRDCPPTSGKAWQPGATVHIETRPKPRRWVDQSTLQKLSRPR